MLAHAPHCVTVRVSLRTLLLAGAFVFSAGDVDAQVKRTYTVRSGDTLYRIAVNHNMSVAQLQELNGITGTLIRVGQVLRLTDGPVEAAVSDSLAVAPPPVEESVGQTEAAASSDSLAAERGAATDPPVEMSLEPELPELPDPVTEEPGVSVVRAVVDSSGAVRFGTYRPRPGETLLDVAFALGVSLDTLKAFNPDHAVVLTDGDPIRVPGRFASSEYTVRPGDSLTRVAERAGVTLAELRAANPGTGDVIRVGQRLRVPSTSAPASPTLPLAVAEGKASVYPDQFRGRLMASGDRYYPAAHILAHPTLPFGSVVMVENAATGTSTFAEVADRMPVSTEYVVEVSRSVAEAIGLGDGTVRVRILLSGAAQ